MPEPAVGIDRATAMQPVRVQLARVPVIVFEEPYGVKRLDPNPHSGRHLLWRLSENGVTPVGFSTATQWQADGCS